MGVKMLNREPVEIILGLSISQVLLCTSGTFSGYN